MPQTRQCRKSAGTTPFFFAVFFHAHLPAGHCLLWSDRSLVCPFAIWVLYKVLPQLSAPDEIQAVGFIGSIFQRGAQGQAAGVGLGRCCQLPGPILSLRGNGQLPLLPPYSCRAGRSPTGLRSGGSACQGPAPPEPGLPPLRCPPGTPCHAPLQCPQNGRCGPARRPPPAPAAPAKSAGPASGGPHGVPAFAVRLPALQKIAQSGVFFGIRFVFCQPAAQGKQLPLHHAHLGGIVLG